LESEAASLMWWMTSREVFIASTEHYVVVDMAITGAV
jgi:hypothetical protein